MSKVTLLEVIQKTPDISLEQANSMLDDFCSHHACIGAPLPLEIVADSEGRFSCLHIQLPMQDWFEFTFRLLRHLLEVHSA